jgi:hypothetical protein
MPETYRELDEEVRCMVADLPRPPRRLMDVDEYIMRVLDIGYFKRIGQQMIETGPGRWPRLLLRTIEERKARAIEDERRAIEDFEAGNYEPLFDVFLLSKHILSLKAKQLIIAKARGTFESPRSGPGRPPKSPAERGKHSILPLAEDTLFVIYGLIAGLLPNQRGGIYDRALILTEKRMLSEYYEEVTTTTLNWFIIKLGPKDPKRFGKPKLKLKGHRLTITQYLNIG